MTKARDLCLQPVRGPLGVLGTEAPSPASVQTQKGEQKMVARVGKPAPDFEANAFLDGGFKNIKLSDYKGQWVVLCFYPGDFTFV